MRDPYRLLDLEPTTDDDAAIKRAYLQKVRQYPPEQAPQQFQEIRAAFESVETERKRREHRLLARGEVSAEEVIEQLLRGAASHPFTRPQRGDLLAALVAEIGVVEGEEGDG
ncbi:MAG: J domain-containing protein [Gammaproteobacteria bacterium]|nr:J domain-containing protein [Gammaproteobacteria bacterium]